MKEDSNESNNKPPPDDAILLVLPATPYSLPEFHVGYGSVCSAGC